jgi:hypothetical protein
MHNLRRLTVHKIQDNLRLFCMNDFVPARRGLNEESTYIELQDNLQPHTE